MQAMATMLKLSSRTVLRFIISPKVI